MEPEKNISDPQYWTERIFRIRNTGQKKIFRIRNTGQKKIFRIRNTGQKKIFVKNNKQNTYCTSNNLLSKTFFNASNLIIYIQYIRYMENQKVKILKNNLIVITRHRQDRYITHIQNLCSFLSAADQQKVVQKIRYADQQEVRKVRQPIKSLYQLVSGRAVLQG